MDYKIMYLTNVWWNKENKIIYTLLKFNVYGEGTSSGVDIIVAGDTEVVISNKKLKFSSHETFRKDNVYSSLKEAKQELIKRIFKI